MSLELDVLAWYGNHVKPFLEEHAPDRLGALENDRERLTRITKTPETLKVCFLGNSGIGKSTLLNALAAGDRQVLPAGGIGPLTAQATEIYFNEVARFEATYHPKALLWRLTFALQARLDSGTARNRSADKAVADIEQLLDSAERDEILAEVAPTTPEDASAGAPDRVEEYTKQARQIITGDQFSRAKLDYLVDALRIAGGHKPLGVSELLPEDQQRVSRLQTVLRRAEDDRTYTRAENTEGSLSFQQDLHDHAAGFLSPLIQKISVGWPSPLLRKGLMLIDLPGIGIARDAYREVTKRYVREQARAVVLVVDKAGPTEASIDLLRASGYWDRLVGAADDPLADPCSLIIAVTRVDDNSLEEWQLARERSASAPPKKPEVFAGYVSRLIPRMRQQIDDQLAHIVPSDNSAVTEARSIAKRHLLEGMTVHAVSAPEYRRVLRKDEDDLPFLKDEAATGIPGLQRDLTRMAVEEGQKRSDAIFEISNRLARASCAELSLIEAQWREKTRTAAEAEKLRLALDEFLAPRKKEYDLRVGMFREFLDNSVRTRVSELVLEARVEAEKEIVKYLRRLRGEHWMTLKAAVTRGGVWLHGRGRQVNLPDDIANYFQEPMAAVWSTKLLKDIRTRTGRHADDVLALVTETCGWASEHAGTLVEKRVLKAQQQRVADGALQLRDVGREAVEELRNAVKTRLMDVIKKPIQRKCEKFVERGDHIGAGVKNRISQLFEELASEAAESAVKPAKDVLMSNAQKVREEIRVAFEEHWKDPLSETAALIVEKHEDAIQRSDAQRRGRVLAALDAVKNSTPAGFAESAAAEEPIT